MRNILFVLILLFPLQLFAQEEFLAKISVKQRGGSGVIIKKIEDSVKNGYLGILATAYHVVKDNKNATIKYQNGQVCSTAIVVSTDKDNDLALIVSWIPNKYPPCKIYDHGKGIPKQVTFVGYPFGGELKTTTGTYMYTEKSFNCNDCYVQPGWSGGGAFLGKELVGITLYGEEIRYHRDDSGRIVNRNKFDVWPVAYIGSYKLQEMLKEIEGKTLYR